MALNVSWKLHTANWPQSSGKVECMNRTLKEKLSKLCQETSLGWTDLLSLAVLCSWCTLQRDGFSPFKILYGWSPPLLSSIPGSLRVVGDSHLQDQLIALGKSLMSLHSHLLERIPISLGTLVHPHLPGDRVWVKDWKHEPLFPIWTGPHTVILVTPTALKVSRITPWIHHI